MGFPHGLSTLSVATTCIALYVAYRVYIYFKVEASRKILIAQHGCKPITQFPDSDPTPLGYGILRQNMKWFAAGQLLDGFCQRFEMAKSNTFAATILGGSIYTTRDPELMKCMLATEFKDWSIGRYRMHVFAQFMGKGIFTLEGSEWTHSRDMLRPNFVRSQIGDIVNYEGHVRNLVDAIPRDGSTVDLAPLFFKFTLDAALDFLIGQAPESSTTGPGANRTELFARSVADAQSLVTRGVVGPTLAMLLPRIPFPSFSRMVEYANGFVDSYVDKALENAKDIKANPHPDGRYTFLNELVRQTSDKVRIRSELLNILLAGRDTTAALLTNVWWTLSQRPDVYAALRAEVQGLGSEELSFERIKEMKYLRGVLNESLRLHPVVALNLRQAAVDTVLPLGGGPEGKDPLFVPKRKIFSLNVYAMHRRKDIFGEDADEFKPERWIGEDGLRQSWGYLPFGGGPRICIGQQFALMEASYVTIRLMQEFGGVERRDLEPWTEYVTITCINKNGCKLAMIP